MKARNNKTGEIVTDFSLSKEFGTISYIDSNNVLRFDTPCDGEWTILDNYSSEYRTFRAEAVKDILCSVLSGGIASGMIGIVPEKEAIVRGAIEVADELIKQLRQ